MRNKLITLSFIFDGNVHKMYEALQCNLVVKVNDNYIKQLHRLGIKVLTIIDDNYPKYLKNLNKPPLVLYALGDVEILNQQMAGVIGSRSATKYSHDVCKQLIKQLDYEVIVSGFAYGIDSFAHFNAIMYNKKTVAIIGSGFNKIYPNNRRLIKLMQDGHLMLSEYPPNVCPKPFHFPLRNRIIAALVDNLYVIEAKEHSGSLITANIALDLGKNIYCAPGNFFDNNYAGSHRLINDGAFLLELRKEEKV